MTSPSGSKTNDQPIVSIPAALQGLVKKVDKSKIYPLTKPSSVGSTRLRLVEAFVNAALWRETSKDFGQLNARSLSGLPWLLAKALHLTHGALRDVRRTFDEVPTD